MASLNPNNRKSSKGMEAAAFFQRTAVFEISKLLGGFADAKEVIVGTRFAHKDYV
jgi:hypothetical protein